MPSEAKTPHSVSKSTHMMHLTALLLIVTLAALACCVSAEALGVVPKPAKLKIRQGAFELNAKTVLLASKGALSEAKWLASALAPSTGYQFKAQELTDALPEQAIVLKVDPSLRALGAEGYRLSVLPARVEIVAPKAAGVFYGIQTLLQMLPPQVFSHEKLSGQRWQVPCAEIEDKPRYSWRGSLLDCCRHFYTVDFIKKYIDLLAMHKMNVLHWHLTEDQGWRLEIKKYPRLTEFGAWRESSGGGKYGGFYTQKEVKDIVKYASNRHVTVVPEIELPGHAVAAIASYPELSCTGGPFKVQTAWGVFPDVYCAGNDKTFAFLEDVLSEVMKLFPSKYIHIGGDECPKDRWKTCPKCQARIKAEGLKDEFELQSYFIRRIETFLNKNGKTLIGWDEILEGGLAPNAAVQSWRGFDGGIVAAREGHDVIMSPYSHCYLDYPYSSINTEKAYSFEPTPEALVGKRAERILGLEGNLWSEHTPTYRDVERQVFPRLCALAEVAWTPTELRDWDGFQPRLAQNLVRLNLLDVAYHADPMIGYAAVGEWNPAMVRETLAPVEWDITKVVHQGGDLLVMFSFSQGAHAISISLVSLLENGVEVSVDKHDGWSGATLRDNVYKLALKDCKPGATYRIRALIKGEGGTDSHGTIAIKEAK